MESSFKRDIFHIVVLTMIIAIGATSVFEVMLHCMERTRRPSKMLVVTDRAMVVVDGDEAPQTFAYRRMAFNHAVAYLSKSKTAREVLEELRHTKPPVEIYIGEDAEDQAWLGNYVIWNPHSGLITTDCKQQTASLALLHELGHILHAREDVTRWQKDTETSDEQYDDVEERRTILEVENVAAKELGEPQRYDHSGYQYNTLYATKTKAKPNSWDIARDLGECQPSPRKSKHTK